MALNLLNQFRDHEAKDFLTARNILILGGALVYFINPLDAIPDVIAGIGWLDDLGIMTLAMSYLRFSPGKKVELHELPSDDHNQSEGK
jgi:uncharacterized membrane protein YkvA (DUF1232 family)